MVLKLKKEKEELLKKNPKMSEEEAAIKIEAHFRGNHEREKLRRMKMDKELTKKSGLTEDQAKELHAEHEKGMTEEQAALKIEAIQRGNRDRAKVKKMIADKKALEEEGEKKEKTDLKPEEEGKKKDDEKKDDEKKDDEKKDDEKKDDDKKK